MFSLPSIWNIIISTIVFFIAAWYIRRLLNEHSVPNGVMRSLVVFVLAYMFSWVSGELVDWGQEKINGPQPIVQKSEDLTQLLKATGFIPN